MDSENTLYWIWLSMAVTAASPTFRHILDKLDDEGDVARRAYAMDGEEIKSVIGSRSKDALALSDKRLDGAESVLDFCTKKGVGILTYGDAEYPDSLRGIKSPPVLLYYRGKLPDFNNEVSISVVGTRRLTGYGKANAFKIAYDLARAGATVVSGMAIGVDSVAHAGAIAAGGKTVAVIGTGIDVCYPKEHLTLAREIVKDGCVLTEFLPGTKPNKRNFPIRNRIISALSRATLIIEGKERSGAAITARYAKEEGRRLFALPGNVGSKASELPNLLIKNGASLCTSADDIITAYENDSLGVLSLLKLSGQTEYKIERDMDETLSSLKVSCVTQDDSLFGRLRRRRESAAVVPKPVQTQITDGAQPTEAEFAKRLEMLDGISRTVYLKIPQGEDCLIESLIDGSTSLRAVMKCLLRLEMSGLVTMLPGERVRRKSI